MCPKTSACILRVYSKPWAEKGAHIGFGLEKKQKKKHRAEEVGEGGH